MGSNPQSTTLKAGMLAITLPMCWFQVSIIMVTIVTVQKVHCCSKLLQYMFKMIRPYIVKLVLRGRRWDQEKVAL
jgi:hypothetical protein